MSQPQGAMSTIRLMVEKVNLAEKLSLFDERWSPKIVAELNDAHVKVVKLEGECHVVLIEPKTTLNTGNVRNERTVDELERL